MQLQTYQTNHTREYDRFKTAPGNRQLYRDHIRVLVRSFEEHPQLVELRPILVNSQYEVIDGQHRLEALKVLGLSVPYIVADDLSIETAQLLNATQKAWSAIDFLLSYQTMGVKDYVTLQRYLDEFGFPLRPTITILSGLPGGRAARRFKNGDFETRGDIETADHFFHHAIDLLDASKFAWGREERYLMALYKLYQHNDYDVNRMLFKVKETPIAPQANRVGYIAELERVYNFRAGDKSYTRFI